MQGGEEGDTCNTSNNKKTKTFKSAQCGTVFKTEQALDKFYSDTFSFPTNKQYIPKRITLAGDQNCEDCYFEK